jgi:SAM-dependent methyltransferase
LAEETGVAQGPQHLKNLIESDIVRRCMVGERLLDVGIGTGRVSLPLAAGGIRLTGIDASAAMIERCAADPRASGVRLVPGELEQLPFAAEAFDTVISIDTFVHFADWEANLDELMRVTRFGGRTIVDVGSRDHIDAVAVSRGCVPHEIRAMELGDPDAFVLRLAQAELRAYAVERDVCLAALIPYGAVLGGLVPNYWLSDSYAVRGGGIDRLVSWLGADPLLFAFAEFIERRIVQQLPPSMCGRMFAVFERQPASGAYGDTRVTDVAACDERGPAAWHAELRAHLQHEANRSFAITFLLAARAAGLSEFARAALPELLLRDLERAEHAMQIDDACAGLAAAWRSRTDELTFHGVDLAPVFARSVQREVRGRCEPAG